MPDAQKKSALESILGVVTEVRAGEGVTALLLTLNVFLLLTAYYVIKPVREALILVMESGAEYKSYMGGAIAITLLIAVPLYARAASRFARNRLVVGVTLFFVSHLVLFYVGSSIAAVRPYLGLVFYLWVGIFNMMVVAQFWAFANDVYTDEQGKRLFALVGLGASVGAAAGSLGTKYLIEPLGTFQLLLLSGALLVACAAITQVVHVRETRRSKERSEAAGAEEEEEEKLDDKKGAFKLVFQNKYLRYIAAFSLLFTFVNTNGEYLLGKLIAESADERAEEEVTPEKASEWLSRTENAEGRMRARYDEKKSELDGKSFEEAKGDLSLDLARKDFAGPIIGERFSTFFLWVNILGIFIQMFLVSRLVKFLGVKWAFFILPAIAFGDAVAFTILPVLTVLWYGKTAENATDYSLNNTLRNMLWLPTTREMKYKAKQAVDTFFVRMGDVSSAILVFIGANLMSWPNRGFSIVNLVLVALWLVVAWLIVKEHARLTSEDKSPDATSETA